MLWVPTSRPTHTASSSLAAVIARALYCALQPGPQDIALTRVLSLGQTRRHVHLGHISRNQFRLLARIHVNGERQPSTTLAVVDQGQSIEFSFDDMMRYHGPGSPGGVAHAFKILERAFALLEPDGPPERREITIETPFGGPGARDAFELVTRAVTEDRYVVDPKLARPERGRTLERFVFRLAYRDRAVTLLVRAGYVTDEFIELARKESRTAEDDNRLAVLKREMADRVMSTPAIDVYDATDVS